VSDYTGIEPPRPAAEPASSLDSQMPSRSWRLPLIVGGAAVTIVLAFGVAIGVFALSEGAARLNDSNDLAAAEKVVLAFDTAYENVDCDAFEGVTTSDARDQIVGDDYDCDVWQRQAETLTVAGDYSYTVDVTSSRKRGDMIRVSTSESYAGDDSVDYLYWLERDGSGWLIVEYGEH
jgi:hypothetical protein